MFRWGIEKQFTLETDPKQALRERIGATVREHLQEYPNASLQQLVELFGREQGKTVSMPWGCVLRQELGLEPDGQQSRAARSRRAKKRQPA